MEHNTKGKRFSNNVVANKSRSASYNNPSGRMHTCAECLLCRNHIQCTSATIHRSTCAISSSLSCVIANK